MGKIVWGRGKRKVKRSFQYTLSSRRSRCVVIAIRFFVNLIASIDLDKAPIWRVADALTQRSPRDLGDGALGLGNLCLFD